MVPVPQEAQQAVEKEDEEDEVPVPDGELQEALQSMMSL